MHRDLERQGVELDILFLLVPLSLVLVGVVGVFLFWAVQTGQFEEVEQEGLSILYDNDGNDCTLNQEIKHERKSS